MADIPNSSEFFRGCMMGHQSVYNRDQICFIRKAVEFAKLHVEATLEAAAKQACTSHTPFDNGSDEGGVMIGVNKDSILSAYPLTNIK